MNLPSAERAVVDPEKIRDYCLNPDHPIGKHKARVFKSALGLGPESSNELTKALLHAALNKDAKRGKSNEFGQFFIVDFEFRRGEKSANIRSVWTIKSN